MKEEEEEGNEYGEEKKDQEHEQEENNSIQYKITTTREHCTEKGRYRERQGQGFRTRCKIKMCCERGFGKNYSVSTMRALILSS